MSLPILKASYICTRLFFCPFVMKSTILAFLACFLMLCHGNLLAQHTRPILVGNQDYITIQGTLKPAIQTGYYLFQQDSTQSQIANLLHSNLTFDFDDDSSAFTRLTYELGPNINQSIGASLKKPLQNKSKWQFHILRTSNPGWIVENNHVRQTTLWSTLDFNPNSKWKSRLGVHLLAENVEHPGGARDSNDVVLESWLTEVGTLSSDILLTQAYAKQRQLAVVWDHDFQLVKSSGLSLSYISTPTYRNFSFLYNDDAPNYTAYPALSDSIGTIRDSALYHGGEWSHLIRTELKNINSTIDLGVKPGMFWVQLNGGFSRRTYLPVTVRLNNRFKNHRLQSVLNWHLLGENANGHELNVQHYWNSPTDTSAAESHAWSWKNEIWSVNNVAADVFRNYQSSLLNTTVAPLEKIGNRGLSSMIGWSFRSLGAGALVSAKQMHQFTYFSEQAAVIQAQDQITLLQTGFWVKLQSPRWNVYSILRYTEDGDDLLDIPNWWAQFDASFAFPMFSEHLAANIGIQSQYMSAHNAQGYLPYINERYYQSTTTFEDYHQLDAYFQATIRTATFRFSGRNLLYGVTDDTPIIIPYHYSLPRWWQLQINVVLKN